MAVPASPCVAASFFVDTEPGDQSKLFGTDDSVSIGLYTTFGEDDSNTSFGSWPDPSAYSCCSEVSSSFPTPSAESLTSLLTSDTPSGSLPTEEDLNFAVGAEFLQEHFRSEGSSPSFVQTPELYNQQQLFEAAAVVLAAAGDIDSPGSRSLEDSRSDDFQNRGFNMDDDSVTSLQEEEEPVDGVVHIPPPLNKKRIEMYDGAYYESIEAAEVPLDVIENKRPFQCGLAGCHKTFKNPQTMKMHHKTHFSDGSTPPGGADLLQVLPTLSSTPNASANNNSNNNWMAGRSKKIPSRCPKCRKTFVGLYELRRHYGRKHSEGERPFQCRKCDKRFYIEVDVRDHEKLCGEQIECKCGLKFAFKCNMVAHKKAHPACQENAAKTSTSVNITTDSNSNNNNNNNNVNSTSVNIMTTYNGEDSSTSRWITPKSSTSSSTQQRTKRCHELVEETRPDLMSKLMKVYSQQRGATTQDSGGGASLQLKYNFAGLGLFTEGGALWSNHNLHYPAPLPGPLPSTCVFGTLDPLQRRGAKLSALDLLQLAGVTPGL